MTRYRPTRVGELIQAEIAQLLLRQLKDPRLRMVTISHVDVSADLRHACVYISRLGSDAEQQAALAGFERAAGFIRSHLGKHLTLRYSPALTFKLDTTIAYGARISQILHDILPSPPADSAESETLHA
ncbi:MAG: 30S ribosome-binding factor RbfA [Candidatus Tectomicrobia bacterium]|uniref:Ribosome-binding factor A n=1 Tax=Tectimicrobiota bacterium TaxID=2528274 RepID=A0A937W1Y1_UNCTE|nr:30S ribosome-binding factor RbfA [Candidatus Tectomicrobia bacterium]